MSLKRSNAFTLVELLVVVSIIVLLMGLLVPALGSARNLARQSACLSNLHQIGLASQMYLDDHDGQFWRYYVDVPDGRLWWFGLEPGGAGSGTNRPLDVTRGIIGSILNHAAERLICPQMDYHDPKLVQKFDKPSASYGYNKTLGPPSLLTPTARRSQFLRPAELFVFADGIHFDSTPTTYNEGHYIQFNNHASFASGYAHFRHHDQAQLLLLDGHCEAQTCTGPIYQTIGGGPAANLAAPDGSSSIYGL